MLKAIVSVLVYLCILFPERVDAAVPSGEMDHKEEGAYRVSIGLFQPEFSEAERYEDFYESPNLGASVFIEHYPWEWAVTLGYSLHIGYYQDSGRAGVVSGDSITEDEDAIDFMMAPIQISLSMLATPFPESKWFTVSAWFGFERTMFNETRRLETTTDSSDSSATNQVFTNFGFKNATVLGGSLNILIKGKSSNSIVDVMGLRRIFLSPYLEIVNSTEKDGLQFGGNRLGVAFSFELDD